MDRASGENPATEKAFETVRQLYDLRDHYFERFDISRAKYKTEEVRKELQKTLGVLDQLQAQIPNKAEYFMLKGKALNVLPHYDPEAQKALSKAVKLDPKLVEAWIQLGEVYWKNKDIEAARNCFLGALNHSQDKVALRNLSLVLRQFGKTEEEKLKFVEESIEKAKKALQLDIKDGTSWLTLGNGYLSLFFASGQNPKILKQCLSAYQQAERDPISKNNPDLHFNRAAICRYEEDYEAALEDLAMAAKLDPTWEEAFSQEAKIIAYLEQTMELIETKGRIRAKKLTNMINSIKDSDLGPFAGGKYTSAKGESIKLDPVLLEDLTPGYNEEKVIIGKVVSSIISDMPVCFSFCMVDKAGTCCSVTVYNIVSGYGVKIGDSVAIAEPFLKVVDFTYKNKCYKFKSIRINSPVVMVVNGHKQGLDKSAPLALCIKVLSE